LKGMGTTCVGALVRDGVAAIANVGDSRVYLLRDGTLAPLTHDHVSLHNSAPGETDVSEIPRSRFHNTITRAIGFGRALDPDVALLTLIEGDLLLLCSDGLTNTVEEDAIARLLRDQADPRQACDRLVAAAIENGGDDNISVIVMHYGQYHGTTSMLAPADSAAAPQHVRADSEHKVGLPRHKSPWWLLGILLLALIAGAAVLHLLHRF
jgi:serine/threonine protein phosphatase PrpC